MKPRFHQNGSANGKASARSLLRLASYSRFRLVREKAWKAIAPKAEAFEPPQDSTRVLFCGDVCFDREIRVLQFLGAYRSAETTPRNTIIRRIRRKAQTALYQTLFTPGYTTASIAETPFQELLIKTPENQSRSFRNAYARTAIRFKLDSFSDESGFDFPFKRISSFFKQKDLVAINLETPLATNPRPHGFFVSDPAYARAMKAAGISLVTLANNHVFDAGENGFAETLQALSSAGVPFTGAGRNLQEARKGQTLHCKGIKHTFLNYTQYCNSRFASIAADYPGILPMDRELMVEDVKRARDHADFVFVLLHWGFENQPNVHPRQVEIAHLLIDAGADAIIGHHPHVPHGIELYKGKPILYSLGNFIFGHGSKDWMDNFLAEVIIDKGRLYGVVIHPVSGRQSELYQPALLEAERANYLLQDLKLKSSAFGTGLAIRNNAGYLRIT